MGTEVEMIFTVLIQHYLVQLFLIRNEILLTKGPFKTSLSPLCYDPEKVSDLEASDSQEVATVALSCTKVPGF